jgi:hypothetical protein
VSALLPLPSGERIEVRGRPCKISCSKLRSKSKFLARVSPSPQPSPRKGEGAEPAFFVVA